MSRAAERTRRVDQLVRARLDPLEPVWPPAALMFGCLLEPRFGGVFVCRIGPEAGLWVAGRIYQALDMTAVGQDERAAFAKEFRGFVATLPRRDVVGGAADDVAVHVDAAHVEWYAAHQELAVLHERIGLDHIEEVAVQLARQARRVAV